MGSIAPTGLALLKYFCAVSSVMSAEYLSLRAWDRSPRRIGKEKTLRKLESVNPNFARKARFSVPIFPVRDAKRTVCISGNASLRAGPRGPGVTP